MNDPFEKHELFRDEHAQYLTSRVHGVMKRFDRVARNARSYALDNDAFPASVTQVAKIMDSTFISLPFNSFHGDVYADVNWTSYVCPSGKTEVIEKLCRFSDDLRALYEKFQDFVSEQTSFLMSESVEYHGDPFHTNIEPRTDDDLLRRLAFLRSRMTKTYRKIEKLRDAGEIQPLTASRLLAGDNPVQFDVLKSVDYISTVPYVCAGDDNATVNTMQQLKDHLEAIYNAYWATEEELTSLHQDSK